MNDLATESKELHACIDVNGWNVGILFYADNIALVALSEIKLQSMLNVLYRWLVKWCINVHVNRMKLKVMHFRKERDEQSNYMFTCGECKLSYVSCYKYLRATMSEFF